MRPVEHHPRTRLRPQLAARLVALWLVVTSAAALPPRPAPPDPSRLASGGATRWENGRVEADVVAWSAGSSTAAACEALRAARSRTGSEISTAALPSRTGEFPIAWLAATAPPSTEPTRLVASRWSDAAPRAPPA